MKKMVERFLIIVLLGSTPGFSQTPVDSLLNFFPLQTGNRWQYRVIHEIDFTIDTSYTMFSVLGDTVLSGGRVYRILNGHWDRYFRIDTTALEVQVFYPWDTSCPDSERTMFQLAIPDTGHFSDCAGFPVWYYKGYQPVGLLPYDANAHVYTWYDGLTHVYKLSEGFGVSFWEVSELGSARGELVAAIIDSVQYGQFIVGIEPPPGTAAGFELYQNYPNPFNPSTKVRFQIPRGDRSEFGLIELTIYNALGEVVKTLASGKMNPGSYVYTWDGTDNSGKPVAGGVYFYRLRAGKYSAVRKMLLLH